ERAFRWARRRPAAAALVALLLGGVLLGLGLAVRQWRHEHEARRAQKVRDAARLTLVLREFQQLYAVEILERVQPLGVKVSHDYTTQRDTVPLPPTLLMELARRIGDKDGCTVR